VSIVANNGTTAATATTTIPGWIDGVAQIQLQAAAVATPGPAFVVPLATGTMLRDRLIVIRVRAGS
jgi:hypothetical protein